MYKKYTIFIILIINTFFATGQPYKQWATYFGNGPNNGLITETSNIIYGKDGFIYIAGFTVDNGINLATPNSFIPNYPATVGVTTNYLAKFDTLGNRIWCTYVGNNSPALWPRMVIDTFGNIFLTAHMASPTTQNNIGTPGTYNPTLNPSAISNNSGYSYLAKFNSSGQRIWGTYLESPNVNDTASFNPFGITTDKQGNIIVCGLVIQSNYNFPSSFTFRPNLIGTSHQTGFVQKFNPSGNLVWGTYYGATQSSCTYVACDNTGNIYMTGGTNCDTGIATAGSSYPSRTSAGLDCESYIVKFNSNGQRIWGTYTNGMDAVAGIVSKGNNGFYLMATTRRDTGIATTGTHQQLYGGSGDVALTSWDNEGHKIWGTYYGGNAQDFVGGLLSQTGELNLPIARRGMDIDENGNILIVGGTYSANNIEIGCTYKNSEDTSANGDGFMAKFYPDGKIMWGSYFDTDLKSVTTGKGLNFYMATETNKENIATAGAFQPVKTTGKTTGYVTRMWGDYQCQEINEIVFADSNHLSIGQNYNNYQWYFNGQEINGAQAADYDALDSGMYFVTFKNNCNCSYVSASYLFNPHPTDTSTGISFSSLTGHNIAVIAFPNPAQNTLSIQGRIRDLKEPVLISITDVSGKRINSVTTIAEDGLLRCKMDISTLSRGIYLITIYADKNKAHAKFIKQ